MENKIEKKEPISEYIAYKKINDYTYEVGYVENGVFDCVATKRYYGDALDMCGLMQIANPHLEIKQIK